MLKKIIFAALVFFLCRTVLAVSELADRPAPYNQAILDVIRRMPEGGGYDTSAQAFRLFKAAIGIQDNHL